MTNNENFELLLKELELTVAQLEKGIELSNKCSEKLELAKQKITKLTEAE